MTPVTRPLPLLAAINAGLHLIGLAAAANWIQPGTPFLPLGERMTYVAAAPWGWTAGWAVWMVCALALLAFVEAAEARLAGSGRLATALAAAGVAVDLLCEAVWVLVIPEVAARGDEGLFLALERLAAAGGTVAANGLYSLAILRLAWALRRDAVASGLGAAVGCAGLLLVGAGWGGDPAQVAWTTGLTIGLYCLWVFAAARGVIRVGAVETVAR